MGENRSKGVIGTLIPRVVKAAILSFIMGGEAAIIFFIPEVRRYMAQFYPSNEPFLYLIIMFAVFEFFIQLTYNTIFYYLISGARAFIVMMLLYYWSEGGIFNVSVPIDGRSISVTMNLSFLIYTLLLLSLLTIAKNVLGGIQFLAYKEEAEVSV